MFRLVTTPDGTNPDEHDLSLGEDGRLVLLDSVTGETSIDDLAQTIRTRLLHFEGENYLDSRTGVPWFRLILRKNPNLVRARAAIRRAILTVPSVVAVPVVDLSLDRTARRLSITFEAVTDRGARIRSVDYPDLIVEV